MTEEKIGCGDEEICQCGHTLKEHKNQNGFCLHKGSIKETNIPEEDKNKYLDLGIDEGFWCQCKEFVPSCQKKKENQVVILDDNELSIMQYAKEFPDNWKKICNSLEKDKRKMGGRLNDEN
jgi:superfamily I DNA and RNA helicase